MEAMRPKNTIVRCQNYVSKVPVAAINRNWGFSLPEGRKARIANSTAKVKTESLVKKEERRKKKKNKKNINVYNN